MEVRLVPELYKSLRDIEWFSRCGIRDDARHASVVWVPTQREALDLIRSASWKDARTEAQGRLTGFLAKEAYELFGSTWNQLVRESRRRIDAEVGGVLSEAAERTGLGKDIVPSVLLDLNRAAVEGAYVHRFRRAPCFFGTVLKLYASGHLPCGWTGDLDDWPIGSLLVY